VTLPSAANPHITTGGMVGDGKLEYFHTMGPLARAATADYAALEPGEDLEIALARMDQAGLSFPVVAKPDIGWCGYGVRLIQSALQLESYLNRYPKAATLVLQRYVPDEGEAGLFYVRAPGEASGRILGILLRYYPKAIGDGRRTLRELIEADIRLHRLTRDGLHESSFDPDHVPAQGEIVRLALIGSTRVGGLYMDGTTYDTPALTERLDQIARDMKTFHIGRFDVRYTTLAALQAAKFTIMEVNGAGSEAVHAWDPKYTIPEVYKMVFAKQRILFAIGAACRKAGNKPCGILNLARLQFQQQDLIKRYPKSN
jgi:hypothetical protein